MFSSNKQKIFLPPKKTDACKVPESQKLCLIFDIDGTLVGETRQSPTPGLRQVLLDHKRFIDLNEMGYHQLHYGVENLFRYLHAQNHYCSFAFFSSGSEERNKKFVEALLKKTFFNEQQEERLYLDTPILSRHHATKRVEKDKEIYQKNLEELTKNFDGWDIPLERKVLFDNNTQSVFKNEAQNQEKNLFLVDTFWGSEFEYLIKAQEYQERLKKNYDDEYLKKNLYYSGLCENYYRSFNSIFYIAGVIDLMIKKIQKDPSCEYLEELQKLLRENSNNEQYKNIVKAGVEILKPYTKKEDGQFELQEFTPQTNYVPGRYLSAIAPPSASFFQQKIVLPAFLLPILNIKELEEKARQLLN